MPTNGHKTHEERGLELQKCHTRIARLRRLATKKNRKIAKLREHVDALKGELERAQLGDASDRDDIDLLFQDYYRQKTLPEDEVAVLVEPSSFVEMVDWLLAKRSALLKENGDLYRQVTLLQDEQTTNVVSIQILEQELEREKDELREAKHKITANGRFIETLLAQAGIKRARIDELVQLLDAQEEQYYAVQAERNELQKKLDDQPEPLAVTLILGLVNEFLRAEEERDPHSMHYAAAALRRQRDQNPELFR